MKKIRLEATAPIIEISISADAYGYEKDQNGADLLCGHCDAVMFEAYPIKKNGLIINMQGITCSSCGGTNTLDTAKFEG